jgi:hypothetical protein
LPTSTKFFFGSIVSCHDWNIFKNKYPICPRIYHIWLMGSNFDYQFQSNFLTKSPKHLGSPSIITNCIQSITEFYHSNYKSNKYF